MSRVVLWRCPACKVGEYDDDGTSGDYRPKCYKCGATFKAFEPVEYVPAALAQRLVEALKECSEYMVLPTSADNALAAAEAVGVQ